MIKNECNPEFIGKRIWMYWPDAKACQFAENVENGFMACEPKGGPNIGDLSKIGMRSLKDEITAEYGYLNSGAKKLMSEFFSTVKKGDFVIARNEWNALIGIGIVTGDYYYDESRPKFRHCRKVEWIDTNEWRFPDQLKQNGKWHRVTLIDQPYRKIAEEFITAVCQAEDTEK